MDKQKEVKKNVYIFYHNDNDGYVSAYLFKKEYLNRNYNVIPIECKRGSEDNLTIISRIKKDDIVINTDYMLDIEDLKFLLELKGCEVLVVDHHESALNQVESFNLKKYNNFNYIIDTSKSSIENTWDFLYPNERIPLLWFYLGRWDVFKHKGTSYEMEAEYIEYYCRLLFSSLDEVELFEITDVHLLIGRSLYELKVKEALDIVTSNSKIIKFENLNFLIYNAYRINLQSLNLLDKIKLKKPVVGAICYYIKSNEVKFSIYSFIPDIKVNKLAEKYGGGGHPAAAGFSMNKDQFINFYNKHF